MAPLNQTQTTTTAWHGLSAPPREDGGSAIVAGLLVPHAVCTVFIATRAWSRLRVLHKWFLDDTLIVAAWIFSTAVCVVYTIAAESPNIRQSMVLTADKDVGPLGGDDLQPYLLRTYLGLIFYQMCLCLTKLSILSFYLRMFNYSRPLERRLAWATVCLVLAFGLPLLAMSIFQCHPVTGEFFGGGKPLLCFSFTPLLIASASLHTVTDAWLIVLVIPCVWRLELPARQKAALGVVLSLGVFVMAASLTRLQLSLHANLRPPGGSGVQTADTLAFFVVTILECDVALICACAPTLRPLLARLRPPRSGTGGEDPAAKRRAGGGRRLTRRRARSADLTTSIVVSHQGVYPRATKSEQDDASAKQRRQESFVLGMNDPASPHRLSPVSGFSGQTLADPDSQSSGDEGAPGLEMRTQKKKSVGMARTRTA